MELEPQPIGSLVRAVFCAWQGAGIDFLVLRNYEGLPDLIGNDIDVLVHPAQLDRAERELCQAARNLAFRLHNRGEFASTIALYVSAQSNAQVHFDLVTAFSWRGLPFLECASFLESKVARESFAIPRPAHEAASILLETLIYRGEVKEKYRPRIVTAFQAEAEAEAARTLISATYGRKLAAFLVAAGARGDWALIEGRAGALRRALYLRQLIRQPWRTAQSRVAEATRLARRWRQPPGLTVVLCGADGSGKSTAARGIIDGLKPTFSPEAGRQFHWKPPVFSGRRHAARGPVTDPHARAPRSAWVSTLFFVVHWFEFWLGWLIQVRPAVFRGGLVLIDRFYYDFFVDQRRYRLRVPISLVRLGYRLLFKPDLVVLLDAPIETLRSRKQEVPQAETERQRVAYLKLVSGLHNGRVVDAAPRPAQVTNAMQRVILDFLAERMQRRGR